MRLRLLEIIAYLYGDVRVGRKDDTPIAAGAELGGNLLYVGSLIALEVEITLQ